MKTFHYPKHIILLIITTAALLLTGCEEGVFPVENSKQQSLSTITNYAQNPDTAHAPDVDDYRALGIESVTPSNIADVNLLISRVGKEKVDTQEELKNLITRREKALAVIKAYASDSVHAPAPVLDTYRDLSITGIRPQNIDAINHIVAGLSPDKVDTIQELLRIVDGYTPPTANHPPVADAGADHSIMVNASVTLHCTGSDTDGSIATYQWYQGATEVASTQNYTTPPFKKTGTYTFTCVVTDDDGATASDDVDVVAAEQAPNFLPVADAGEDKTVIIGKPRTIVGYGSDLDGYIVQYTWSDGNTLLATSSHFIYIPEKEGNRTLTLTVTDNRGASRSDTVNIAIKKEIAPNTHNLLEGKNPNVNGTAEFTNVGEDEAHKYVSGDSHTNDGSGSIKLVEHWYNHPITTSTFRLEKDKLYTFGAYMKAVGDDKGQNVMFKIKKDSKNSMELNYNISKAGQWEEVAIPYRAKEAGNYTITVFTHRYAITTDGQYASSDGSNIDRNASILLDDFFVYETKEDEGVKTNEPITPKVPFESSMVKIDALGNWQIQENGEWKDFFPKFVYRDFTDIAESARKYSAYGFTGFANIPSLSQMHAAVDNGMKYNAVQVNKFYDSIKKAITDIIQDINDDKLPATSLIAYTFDNENLPNYTLKKTVSDWINDHDNSNPITGKRDRPIFMLNGIAEGVARNYKNNTGKDYMDVVGTYVTQSGEAINKHEAPINTLSTLQKQHHQIAPVSIMQLQCYYKDTFIPSVFKGIADGAKGLTFWRAGKGDPVAHGCPENFEDNVWAPAIKDTFAKIDEMMPIIKEPLDTFWSASVANPVKISIGTRDHDGKHYIILANFGDKDTYADVYLTNLDATTVKDYFTKEELFTIKDNGYFHVAIGHHNRGFRVLELE